MSATQAICETRPREDGDKSCAVLRLPEPFLATKVNILIAEELATAANSFLTHLAEHATYIDSFKSYASWFTELKLGTGGFRWLPVTWGDAAIEAKLRDPRNSFWVTPKSAKGITRRALVMIATTGKESDGKFVADPFQCAIRVVAHVLPAGDKKDVCSLRFTTFSASLPQRDFADCATDQNAAISVCGKAVKDIVTPWGGTAFSFATSRFRLIKGGGDSPAARILGSGGSLDDSGDSDIDLPVYDYSISIPDVNGDLSNAVVERYPRSTHAAKRAAAVFGKDRASVGKPDEWLKRHPSQRFEYPAARQASTAATNTGAKGAVSSQARAPAANFKVTTMFYPPNRGKYPPERAATTNDARTQTNAQAIAALQGQALLGRIEKTGLSVKHFFKCFNLPVKITLNAPITPGAIDGLTVNAQVTMGSVGLDAHDPDSRAWLKARPRLRVKFAHADLSAALLDATEKTPPQRLSLVTDSRWVWHEFGHVLIAAATGDLELPFVHSVGDGLAAIIHDADSSLRDNAGPRGATFPWVSLPRRHDRCPDRGWCWSGGLHHPSRFWTDTRGGPSYKAYTTEQIMSSTLFCMYQAMGGDETELEKRKAASDNAVSLIIVALALLGPSMHVDADSVQHFVAALLDADECLGTGAADHIIDTFSNKFKMPLSV